MTEDKLMNTCKICGFVAQSPRGVVFHSMKQHNIDRQQYYDMFYKRDGEGICPVCGKPTAFKGLTKGYHEHCSVHCALIDPNVKDKYKTTIQKHYGVDHPMHSRELADKQKSTLLDRYGVVNSMKNPESVAKMRQTNIDRYSGIGFAAPELREKSYSTIQKRYGYRCGVKKQAREKAKITWLRNYGTLNPAQDMKIRQKMKDSQIKNGTSSKIEQQFKHRLDELGIKYIREYWSEKYPFFCDFYLPDFDMYIELNIYWSHVGHYFDINNPEDLALLEFWKQRADAGSEHYRTAIKTWTVSDIQKRDVALSNHLNYLVLWSKAEIADFLYGE